MSLQADTMANEVPVNEQGDIPAFHKLVGEAIRRWAQIEGNLWFLVASILGVDQFRARIVIESVASGRPRRTFVERLTETYLDSELLPEFRSLMRRMDKLGSTRNLLAHASIHVNVNGKENMIMRDTFTTDSMDGGLDVEDKPFPLGELRAHARALDMLFGDFVVFTHNCEGKIHQTARIHREPRDGHSVA